MVLDGIAWLYVRPTGSFPIIGWYVCDVRKEPALECVVVDTERIIGYGFVFIDMLTDVDGVPSNAMRTLDWSIDEFFRLRITVPTRLPKPLRIPALGIIPRMVWSPSATTADVTTTTPAPAPFTEPSSGKE